MGFGSHYIVHITTTRDAIFHYSVHGDSMEKGSYSIVFCGKTEANVSLHITR